MKKAATASNEGATRKRISKLSSLLSTSFDEPNKEAEDDS
jgi:hypothetical protein